MNRKAFIFLFLSCMALGSFVTLAATVAEQDYNLRGYVDASRDANLPFRIPRLGVSSELTQYSAEALRLNLQRMSNAHINWVRQIVRWEEVEPLPGGVRWDDWDKIVGAMREYPQLGLVAVFMNTPAWARSELAEGNNPTIPPRDPGDLASFVRRFAERYKNAIDYYQIWDEPNLKEAWGSGEPRVVDYVALLAASYEAIHSVDPDATVISAALAPTVETGPDNISDIMYLQDMYALGAKEYMDAVAAKPYGFNDSPYNRDVRPDRLNFSRVIALREVMLANGDGAKAVWASNWGWNSLPEGWTGKPSIWGHVTAVEQVNYTLDGLKRAEREWPWIGGMILQNWQPMATCDDPIWGFALVDCHDSPTRLYNALVDIELESTASNGLFSAQNNYARYSGVWTFGKLGADIGWLQDSQFEFDFYGTDVSLLLRQDDYAGYLYPRVGDNQANATPRDAAGNPYVVLTSESLRPEMSLVPIARKLPANDHTLHVTADRGWDRWALAGFGVSSGDLHEPYVSQLGAGILTVFLSILSTAYVATKLQWRIPLSLLGRGLQSLSMAANLVLGVVAALVLLLGMLLTWGDTAPNLFRRDSVPLGLALFTIGTVYLLPGSILATIALVGLFVIFYNRLEVGIALTLFFAPFFLFPVELYRFAFPLSEVLMLVLTTAWLLRLANSFAKKRQITVSQFKLPAPSGMIKSLSLIDYGVLVWLALGAVSLLWAEFRSQAVTELRVMMLEPVFFYFVIRTSRFSKRQFITFLDAMLAAGFLVAVIGLWQYLQGDSIITAEAGARRLASVYGSPNNVALFLGRCLPFVLAFVVLKVDTSRRVASVFLLIVIGVALLLTQSVGALFLGVPASILAVLVISVKSRKRRMFLSATVVIAVGAFLVLLQFPRFSRALDFTSGTNFYRIRVWQSALNVIGDHPTTGLGLDQFLYAFRGKYIMPDAWQEPNLSHPHNIVLDFWVRLGILGVATLIFLQVAFWRQMVHLCRKSTQRSPVEYAVVVGAVGAMVNLLVHGLVDNSVYVQDLCYVFVFLLALVSWDYETRPITDSQL